MTDIKPRVKVPKVANIGEIIEIRAYISHPMHSGRSVDSNGNPIPRKIINQLIVKFNKTEIMNVELSTSISNNPFLVFPCRIEMPGEFEFTWIEDGGEKYYANKKIDLA